jgi:AI-2E family transporter
MPVRRRRRRGGPMTLNLVYQQIENYILQPTIIGKAAQLSGFTVLASVLAFGALFGLIGAIIGVPIAAGLQISRKSSPPAEELASPPQTLRSSSRRPNDRSVSTRKVGAASPHWHDELSSERC